MTLRTIIAAATVILYITNPAWASKTPQELPATQAAASLPQEQRIIKIPQAISYSRNFDADDVNFMPGLHYVMGKTKREATVLVNIHDGSPLNISSTYKKGTRTLSWATPYEAALSQAMSSVSHAHNQSALLTSWTGHKERTFVSFIIIPKDTEMEFKIGYAAPQTATRSYKDSNYKDNPESRPGGGMQMRLNSLPAGAIVLTESLVTSSKTQGKANYSLEKIFKTALENYNSTYPQDKISDQVASFDFGFRGYEEYFEKSFD